MVKAADRVGIKQTAIYELANEGKLHVMPEKESYLNSRVSVGEVREFGRYLGKELWNLPDDDSVMYVGWNFGDKPKHQLFKGNIEEFLGQWHCYDGTVYVGLCSAGVEECVDFVCSCLMRYNQIQMRHRPFSSQRHVYLCWRDPVVHNTFNRIRDVINRKYASEIVKVCHME